MIQGRATVTIPSDPQEAQDTHTCLRIIEEYALWSQGVRYEQLGYENPDGTIPAWKLDEHLLCRRYYEQAKRDKPRTR